MRLVAARAENRAADGENSRERGLVEFDPAVFDEATKAVAEADNLHAVVQRGFADAANGCVETGAIAARSENADAFDFLSHAESYLKPPRKFVEQKFWKFFTKIKMVGATGFNF